MNMQVATFTHACVGVEHEGRGLVIEPGDAEVIDFVRAVRPRRALRHP
ncbi:hypothetical protein [Nonomuraea diastatica]|nr:hypothetical protein [Nonomuraea diastatica]